MAALLLIACGGAERDDSGQIVDGGDLDVFKLRVGDCFQDSDMGEIFNVEAVPCGQPHDNEVYFVFNIEDDNWPGDEFVEFTADEGCLPAFETYVGATYEESRLDFSWLVPTERSWKEKNDREVACILYDANLERLSGSMRNSRQ
jgi:hypothetical protein